MAGPRTRQAHATDTRELILTTAERLFAEHGVAVSNRQISEAAGQANNFAVGYHFGTKTDLVLAIVRPSTRTENSAVSMSFCQSSAALTPSWRTS